MSAASRVDLDGRVLKECRKVIALILTLIFQKSLILGKIPTDWKHDNVCPVYKKGDKHDPNKNSAEVDIAPASGKVNRP